MAILAKTNMTTVTAAIRQPFVHDVLRRKQGCQARFARGPNARIRFGPLAVNQPRHTPSRLAACGVGYCAADDMGRMLCSTIAGSNIARDSYGKVTCEGGCHNAQAQLCEDLQ